MGLSALFERLDLAAIIDENSRRPDGHAPTADTSRVEITTPPPTTFRLRRRSPADPRELKSPRTENSPNPPTTPFLCGRAGVEVSKNKTRLRRRSPACATALKSPLIKNPLTRLRRRSSACAAALKSPSSDRLAAARSSGKINFSPEAKYGSPDCGEINAPTFVHWKPCNYRRMRERSLTYKLPFFEETLDSYISGYTG